MSLGVSRSDGTKHHGRGGHGKSARSRIAASTARASQRGRKR